MDIYGEMQGVAHDLLTEFRQGVKGTVNYIRVTPGVGPVDNPGPSTKVPFDIAGAATGVNNKYVQNGTAIASDLQIIVPVDDRYIPDMKGMIGVDGIEYKIKQILKKPAVGTTVVYIIIFGRG